MNFEQIQTILKRFSFGEKMRIAQIHSRRTFNFGGLVDINELREIPSPWELETFVLLSVKAKEWKYDTFNGKNQNKFYEIINCIRNTNPPIMDISDGQKFITWFFAAVAAAQFEIQEHEPYKYFRFYHYFTFANDKINMKKLFNDKFGCDYYQYILLSHTLWTFYNMKTFLPQMYTTIINHYKIPVSHLVISREQYIALLDSIAPNEIDYLYCLRPSYSFPFIEYQATIHCPLPHLLRRAVTSSMMHRLTERDDELTKIIGKEVYENYLHMIVSESNLFDEVVPEQAYRFEKNWKKTADLMCRKDNRILFLDCKSFKPKIDLRIFSEEAFAADINRLAKSCKQMYTHIRKKFGKEYNYFKDTSSNVTDDIYGLVVVQEDPYIIGPDIYEKTAELLEIQDNPSEYEWLCKHVGIVGIYDIERFCFTGSDIISSITEYTSSEKYAGNCLRQQTKAQNTYPRYLSFVSQLVDDAASELKKIQHLSDI